ncbi:MAG TPA: hypothetical protein VK857_04455 [Desulforhopalus sp.]|nr:hypothetical protein [Desulforhopalus sp.]
MGRDRLQVRGPKVLSGHAQDVGELLTVDFPVNDLSAMKMGKKNTDLLAVKAAYPERQAISCRSGDIVPGLHGGNFRLNSATLAIARRTPPAKEVSS